VGVPPPDEPLAADLRDPDGNRVVIPSRLWHGKVLRDHPELVLHFVDVMRAIVEPDHVAPDPRFRERSQHYVRNVGPSRWLLVVLSYEQEPARLITAYPNRRDPPLWSE
jgi:hypothetical protein